jgi:hypothetical protein
LLSIIPGEDVYVAIAVHIGHMYTLCVVGTGAEIAAAVKVSVSVVEIDGVLCLRIAGDDIAIAVSVYVCDVDA